LNLLCGTVVLAFASHPAQAFREQLRSHPRLPEYNGKNVGPTVPVLVLNRAEQILGDLHPEEVVDAGNAGAGQEDLADLADIGSGHLVNEIGSDRSSPPFPRQTC
jgi:hypothetical protein